MDENEERELQTNKPTSMRLPPETKCKLAALAERYGGATAAVIVAVDLLYWEMFPPKQDR